MKQHPFLSQHAQGFQDKRKQSLPGGNVIAPVPVIVILRIADEDVSAVQKLTECLPPEIRNGSHGGAFHLHNPAALFPPSVDQVAHSM